jgi:hypothetical protein
MKIITLLILLFIFSCSTKKDKNYYDLYKERVLLEMLTTPTPEPLNACIQSYQSAESCLKQTTKAQEFPGGLTEMSLSAVLSNNKMFTYKDQCNATLSGELQSKVSDSAKECIQNCQKKYWDDRLQQDKCKEDFTTQLQGVNSGTNSCIRTCFQLTNVEVKF